MDDEVKCECPTRKALERNRQGYCNILELRKLSGEWGQCGEYSVRYGALTIEEIGGVIADIDAALSASCPCAIRRIDGKTAEELLKEVMAECDELTNEHNKVMEYARVAKGDRDVHSVYEVLDLVPDLRAELAAANTYAKMSADKCLRLRAELAESRNRERALREALTLAQSWAEWAGAHSFETESDNKWREGILGEIEKALRVSGAAAPEDTKEKR